MKNHNFSILAPEGEYSEITYKIYNQKFPNRCDPNLNHITSYECPQKCSCYYWDDSINNFTLVEMGRDHCTSTLNPVLLSTTTTTTTTTTTDKPNNGHTQLVLSITLPVLAVLLVLLLIGRERERELLLYMYEIYGVIWQVSCCGVRDEGACPLTVTRFPCAPPVCWSPATPAGTS